MSRFIAHFATFLFVRFRSILDNILTPLRYGGQFLCDLVQEDFWLTDYELALFSDEYNRCSARWISDHLHRQQNMGLAVSETWRGPGVAPAIGASW